jgi:hypothetical protein
VDIVPHYLQGGERVACFNGLDVVSRYPTGQPFLQRRAADAATFLIHLWQTIGIPTYTQVDNEGCFSGGTTHHCVLGQVVRLALLVGTELVFSPVYHPESNGYVERFHQEYDKHVWQDTYLANLAAVQQQGQHFFNLYRQSGHHSQLRGTTPQERHQAALPRFLPAAFQLPAGKLPLTTGRVHFMRQVQADATVRVLNENWSVPTQPGTAVWVTLHILEDAATLTIYDQAPDATARTCLVAYPFPLKENVQPAPLALQPSSPANEPLSTDQPVQPLIATPDQPADLAASFFTKAFQLAHSTLLRAFFRTDQLVE